MIILFYCHSELSGVLLSSVAAGKSIKSMNPYIQHVLVACWAFKRTIFMNNFLLSINLMSTICPALLFFTFSATDRVAPDNSDAKQRLESGWFNVCNNVESETAGLQNSDYIIENL